MLNEDGGIETDLTVICLNKDHFRIITAAANREHDKFHILKHLSKNINFQDVTDQIACFGIFGPKSRDLLKNLTNENLTNEKISFGSFKEIKINNIKVLAQRLSYVGELGFELYLKMEDSKEIFNLIVDIGKEFQLSLCGVHAMDIMRMETGHLHWGHDISPEENQIEAGLKFAISLKKNVNFIGKQAIEKIIRNGPKKKLLMFILNENKPGFPLLLHDEPIYLNDKIIGRTTSGNYSFCFNKNLSYGYIKSEYLDKIKNEMLFIEVEKKKYSAKLLSRPLNFKNIKNI